MALIPLDLVPRRTTASTTYVYYNGGAIGGGIFVAIIMMMLIIFFCVFIYKHNEAQRLYAAEKIPVSKSRIFKEAAVIALTFGLVCLAGCGSNRSSALRKRGPVPKQAYQPVDQSGGGYVPAPMPSYQPQMDYTYQPQMDYTPISNAAQAPVQ